MRTVAIIAGALPIAALVVALHYAMFRDNGWHGLVFLIGVQVVCWAGVALSVWGLAGLS